MVYIIYVVDGGEYERIYVVVSGVYERIHVVIGDVSDICGSRCCI